MPRSPRVARAKRRGVSPAALLFWGLVLLLLGWGGWTAYSAWQTARARNIAERVIADDGALRGFPVHVAIADNGDRVTLLGLVPKPADALHGNAPAARRAARFRHHRSDGLASGRARGSARADRRAIGSGRRGCTAARASDKHRYCRP